MDEKLAMRTKDLNDDNVEAIAQLFPSCVTESISEDGSIRRLVDFEALKRQLSGNVVPENKERYIFTWPGKSEAQRLANISSELTLRPCRKNSIDFDNTKNIYIEGDNLDVLKLLRETYLGKIKVIYIDPPYNTGNDFIYKDKFSSTISEYNQISGDYEDGNRLVINSSNNGRFHTDWLNMIYPRLMIAKDLLSDDGLIFISIDDSELKNLIKVCDEIFGELNFIANLIWKSKSGGANDSKYFAVDHEYILVYSKNANKVTIKIDKDASVTTQYNRKDEFGEYALDRLDKQSIRYSPSLDYEIVGPDGKKYKPRHKNPEQPNATWRWSKETVKQKYNELVFENGCVYTKNYKKDGAIARSLLIEDRFGRTRTGKTECYSILNGDFFSNPKPSKLIKYLLSISTDTDSIILDFFSGSGTTAQAVMELNQEDEGNRKYILVQLPEQTSEKIRTTNSSFTDICKIGEQRIISKGMELKTAQQTITGYSLDVGFRIFKLDTSNMNDVFYNPQSLKKDILDYAVDNIKSDRSSEDILIQVMLELGIELSSSITKENISDKDVFTVDNGYLIACFDQDVDDGLVRTIANRKPYYAVFRDSSMLSDAVSINFNEIFKTYSPNTKTKVL